MDDRVCAKLQAWAQPSVGTAHEELAACWIAPSQGKERLQALGWKGWVGQNEDGPQYTCSNGYYICILYMCIHAQIHTDTTFQFKNELHFCNPVVLLSPCNYGLINAGIHPILPLAW